MSSNISIMPSGKSNKESWYDKMIQPVIDNIKAKLLSIMENFGSGGEVVRQEINIDEEEPYRNIPQSITASFPEEGVSIEKRQFPKSPDCSYYVVTRPGKSNPLVYIDVGEWRFKDDQCAVLLRDIQYVCAQYNLQMNIDKTIGNGLASQDFGYNESFLHDLSELSAFQSGAVYRMMTLVTLKNAIKKAQLEQGGDFPSFSLN